MKIHRLDKIKHKDDSFDNNSRLRAGIATYHSAENRNLSFGSIERLDNSDSSQDLKSVRTLH